MKKLILPLLLLPVSIAAVACGTPSDGPDSLPRYETTTDPSAPDGGTGTDSLDAGPGFDFGAVPSQIAQEQSQGALAVSDLATLLYSFLPSANGMDVTATPETNAALIASNLQAVLCTSGHVTYTDGTPYLAVDFGKACPLTDTNLVVGGVVNVGVTGDGTSGAAAALQLNSVVVGGYSIDGFVNVSTTSTAHSFNLRVKVGGVGIMAFNGKSSEATSGSATEVLLSGTGVFTGPKHLTPTNSDGVSCVSSTQSVLVFRQWRRALSDCFGNRGSIDVRSSYVCRPTAGPADAAFFTTVALATMAFDASTAASGAATFSMTVPGRVGDDGTPVTSTVTLPSAACPSH